jgi:hypothetical protein
VDYFFIGDPELVTAFKFIGIEGTAVRDAAETAAVFRRITEGWVEEAGKYLGNYKNIWESYYQLEFLKNLSLLQNSVRFAQAADAGF